LGVARGDRVSNACPFQWAVIKEQVWREKKSY
jgi:hypothetical protein